MGKAILPRQSGRIEGRKKGGGESLRISWAEGRLEAKTEYRQWQQRRELCHSCSQPSEGGVGEGRNGGKMEAKHRNELWDWFGAIGKTTRRNGLEI